MPNHNDGPKSGAARQHDDGNSSSGVKSLPLLYPFQMNEMVISVIKMMMVVA